MIDLMINNNNIFDINFNREHNYFKLIFRFLILQLVFYA
jgi:hypothetical protein